MIGAEVVTVSIKRKDAPVKVTFIGYDRQLGFSFGSK